MNAPHLDLFELKAVDKVIENVGGIVAENGPDLSEWDEKQVRTFVTAIVTGFGAELREELKNSEVIY